jgi:hypothetical protein
LAIPSSIINLREKGPQGRPPPPAANADQAERATLLRSGDHIDKSIWSNLPRLALARRVLIDVLLRFLARVGGEFLQHNRSTVAHRYEHLAAVQSVGPIDDPERTIRRHCRRWRDADDLDQVRVQPRRPPGLLSVGTPARTATEADGCELTRSTLARRTNMDEASVRAGRPVNRLKPLRRWPELVEVRFAGEQSAFCLDGIGDCTIPSQPPVDGLAIDTQNLSGARDVQVQGLDPAAEFGGFHGASVGLQERG